MNPSQKYISAPEIQDRFGVSEATLYRWLLAPHLEFPRPMVINRRRFFLLEEIEAWERAQAAKALAGRAA